MCKFHQYLYNKQNNTWPLGDKNFIFSCWEYLSLVRCAHSWEILSALEDKIRIPARPCNILYIYWTANVIPIPMRRSNQLSYLIHHELVRTNKWPAPNVSGFIAQLVRASHRYRGVTGSNPVEVLNFSALYLRNCINCVHSYEDHSLLEANSWESNYCRKKITKLTFRLRSKRQLRCLFTRGLRPFSTSLIQNFLVMFGKVTTFSTSSTLSHGVLIKQIK